MPEDEATDSSADVVTMSSDAEPSQRQSRQEAPQQQRQPHVDVEAKIKLAMAQSDKRFADLELGLAEVRDAVDRFKDLDASALSNLSELPDLKQRVEDLEDLVMVESAGIEELKDIMESVRDGMQPQKPVEGQSTVLPEAMQQRMDEVGGKLAILEDLKTHMDELSHEVARIKDAAAAGGMGQSMQAGNTQMLTAKMENLRGVVDELIKRKVEIDLKLERLDKTMSMMQARGSSDMPDGLKKEIDTLNRNFSVFDSRMDAIESVSKGLSEEMQRVKVSAQKFDTFEKASNLVKDMQSKMEEFRFIENEIKRVSNRVESIYDGMDQRLDKSREMERALPQLKEAVDGMREEMQKRMDESKIALMDRATKEETGEIRDRLAQVEIRMSDTHIRDVSKDIADLKDEVERSIKDSQAPFSVINIEMSDILARLVSLETRLGGLERALQMRNQMHPVVLE